MEIHNKPNDIITFFSAKGSSNIDLTIGTRETVTNIKNWPVHEETISDHKQDMALRGTARLENILWKPNIKNVDLRVKELV